MKIVGIAIILIGTFGLHPLGLDIIAEAQPIATDTMYFPSDHFGAKRLIVSYMALVQAVGLRFLVAVSVFKP